MTPLKRPCTALNSVMAPLLSPSLIPKGAEAPWAAKIKNDPLAERVLAIKMAMLLSTIDCPAGDTLQVTIHGFATHDRATAAAAAEAEPDVEGAQSPAHASHGWDSPSSSTAAVAGSDLVWPGETSWQIWPEWPDLKSSSRTTPRLRLLAVLPATRAFLPLSTMMLPSALIRMPTD